MTYPDNTSADTVAADQLRAIIERIERMHEEKAAIAQDISEIYKEAKGQGFDTRVIKRIVADRAKDSAQLAEFATLYELYCEAIGMVPATRASTRD
jgi:uncharacterized protein (UPF0335 family)